MKRQEKIFKKAGFLGITAALLIYSGLWIGNVEASGFRTIEPTGSEIARSEIIQVPKTVISQVAEYGSELAFDRGEEIEHPIFADLENTQPEEPEEYVQPDVPETEEETDYYNDDQPEMPEEPEVPDDKSELEEGMEHFDYNYDEPQDKESLPTQGY